MRLFPSRKYKSGTGWCLWRWTEVPSDYILRLHLIKTPWFAVCLHWINAPDAEPHLHDHPVTFLSLILRGWYIEHRYEEVNNREHWIEGDRYHRWWNFIRAVRVADRHRIIACAPGTLTLCFMGPKRQEWGFYLLGDANSGWVHWKDYNREKYA